MLELLCVYACGCVPHLRSKVLLQFVAYIFAGGKLCEKRHIERREQ